MSNCATYIGTMVHRRPSGGPAYSRDRAFCMLADVDQLSSVSAHLWLFGFDHLAPIAVASRDFCPGQSSSLRDRVNEQLCAAGLTQAVGGRISLLCFPRVLGTFSSRIGIFFCHAADGTLGALIYDVRDTYGQRHLRVEPVTPAQLESNYFVAQQGRYVFEIRTPARALSIFVYQLSSLGRRLEAHFTAERTTLCDGNLLAALLRQSLPILVGLAATALAAVRQYWSSRPIGSNWGDKALSSNRVV